MQRWFAVLVGTLYAASAAAGDTVATLLARALQVEGGEHSWQLSVGPDDSWLPQINPVGEYMGAGVVYRSASAEFGVAMSLSELGAPFERALTFSSTGVADREAVYEVSWRIELSERFALQSDVQYIRNPGMDASVDSSWMVGLRFELSAR
jgi:hypothetical protein